MVRLSEIFEKVNEIETVTLRVPTHVIVSEFAAKELVSQYNEFVNSDAEMVYAVGEKEYDIHDVGGFLGVSMVVSHSHFNGFKVLEEIDVTS